MAFSAGPLLSNRESFSGFPLTSAVAAVVVDGLLHIFFVAFIGFEAILLTLIAKKKP